jgi:hypothetical protein
LLSFLEQLMPHLFNTPDELGKDLMGNRVKAGHKEQGVIQNDSPAEILGDIVLKVVFNKGVHKFSGEGFEHLGLLDMDGRNLSAEGLTHLDKSALTAWKEGNQVGSVD